LYGLPMYNLGTIPSVLHRPEEPMLGEGWHDGPAAPVYGGTAHESIEVSAWEALQGCPASQVYTYYPQLETVSTDIGAYFQALNTDLHSGTQSRLDQPIQPRLVDEVISTTRGVVFEGGVYTIYLAFDPVVTQLGNSEVSPGDETEITGPRWIPSQVASLSQLETLAGPQKTVVVLPGQYRGEDAQQRVYEEVKVSLYASTLSDWQAPTVTSVTHMAKAASAMITVTATDDTGICRVVVAYTDGEGEWASVDLTASGGDTWQGALELTGAVEYFVQVVDEAGNVAVDDNDEGYYEVGPGGYSVYLPVVLR